MKKKETQTSISLKVDFDGEAPKELKVHAYAFDRSGRFLASTPIREGEVRLEINDDQVQRARIFFAPPPPEELPPEEPTLAQMKRLGAYEPTWKWNSDQSVQILKPIPEALWTPWFWCPCRVRGQVVRPITMDGTKTDLPVCFARVHICEVDRWPRFIRRLPEQLILRLRDELLDEILKPIPRPRPIPLPNPYSQNLDKWIIDPSPENLASRGKVAGRFGRVSFNPQPEPPISKESLNLDASVHAALSSSSVKVVREALISNDLLIMPYLCLWPWLKWYYHCDEIATIETDHQGRFDITHWYLCNKDRPDIYVWVEYKIENVWATVYRPPIPCATDWNYSCGTEIVVRVTDPRVPVCKGEDDPAGKVVVVMGIGENISMNQIKGATDLTTQGLFDDNSPEGEKALFDEDAPFGGMLEPRVQFGRTELFAAGVTHYRWSYRRLTLSDGSPAPAPGSNDDWPHLDHAVIRHYMVIDQSSSDLTVSFPVEDMGPKAKGLFKIQPFLPSNPSDGWATVDSHQDNATAFFPTHLLDGGDAKSAAGKYILKLELFKSDGTLVNLTDEGITLKVPDVNAPFGADIVTTIDAPAENQVVESGKVVAFQMVVHIDNNVCQGNINDVTLNGVAAGECGFLEYLEGTEGSSDAVISFSASHPNDFATFNFNVTRGSAGAVNPASAAGQVGLSNDGFNHVAGTYSKNVPVSTLLNSPPSVPPCLRGAFAESLHVHAMATDGWARLHHLDGPRPGESGFKAFAITAAPPAS